MSAPIPPVWTAPVRFVELDQQGVAFNAHYLTWCDEAMSRLLGGVGLTGLADSARVVASSLAWSSSVVGGDVIEVRGSCVRVGRTSFTLGFDIAAQGEDGPRACCRVETTYVAISGVDDSGRAVPTPVTDTQRALLTTLIAPGS